MSEKNKQRLKQLLEKQGYISPQLYSSVMCALELRENGLSASQANSMAYGKHLLKQEKVVDPTLYQQLSQLTGEVWRQRGRPVEQSSPKEKKSIGICPNCGGKLYLYPKTVACEFHNKSATSCSYVLFRSLGMNYLSEPQIKLLLTQGWCGPIENLKRKDGRVFSSYLQLQKTTERPQVKYVSSVKEAL